MLILERRENLLQVFLREGHLLRFAFRQDRLRQFRFLLLQQLDFFFQRAGFHHGS